MLATRGEQVYGDVMQNAKGLTVLSEYLSRYLGSSPESRYERLSPLRRSASGQASDPYSSPLWEMPSHAMGNDHVAFITRVYVDEAWLSDPADLPVGCLPALPSDDRRQRPRRGVLGVMLVPPEPI
jgi:hypothetical protein